MTLSRRHLIVGAGMAGFLSGCNTLSLFNTFTPKDGGSQRIASDIAYGDNPRQRYDVYAPEGQGATRGLIVFFYGGGWNTGSRSDYGWMGRSLAAMGYVVAVPDYRLYPEVVYPLFLQDAAAAVQHVRANAKTYGADAQNVALVGHSAGAYIATMLALDISLLKFDPLADNPIKACVGIAGPYDFFPFDVPESVNSFGSFPNPAQTQPINHARKTTTRFLLQHSRADTVCYPRNATALHAVLTEAGAASELKLYDGLSHQDCAAVFSVPFRKKGSLRADCEQFLAKTA